MTSTELDTVDTVETVDSVETVESLDPIDASDAVDGATAPKRSKAQRRGAIATLLIVVLCLASVGWLILELVQRPGSKPPGDAQAAISAAEKQALGMMTLNYKTAKADLQRVIDGSTGIMKSQYAQGEPGTAAKAVSTQSVSTGTVTSAGLSYPKGKSSFTGTAAEVLVAGDATVSFPKTKTAPASKFTVNYRFVFEMQKVDGVWKSAQLNFAGLPSYSQVGS